MHEIIDSLSLFVYFNLFHDNMFVCGHSIVPPFGLMSWGRNKTSVISKSAFLNENHIFFTVISPKVVPKHSKSPTDSNAVDSGNGLAPDRRPVITWTNDDHDHRRLMASQDYNELTQRGIVMAYGSTLAEVMTYCTKPLSEPMMTYHQWSSVALT